MNQTHTKLAKLEDQLTEPVTETTSIELFMIAGKSRYPDTTDLSEQIQEQTKLKVGVEEHHTLT